MNITRDCNAYNFHTEIRVRLSETDAVGIVFFGSFSTFMDVGRMDYLNHLGLSRLDGQVRDLIPGAVVRSAANFHSPARYNDVLVVNVRIANIGHTSYTFHFLIENKQDREVVATGEMTLVWLSPEFEPQAVADEFRVKVRQFEGEHLGTSADDRPTTK